MSFIFDRDFDRELAEERRGGPQAPAARHSDEDLAAALAEARAAAREEGRAQGRAEALAEAEAAETRRQGETLEALRAELEGLGRSEAAHRAALERQVLAYAAGVAQQVLPEILARKGQDRALAQIRRGLSLGLSSPRLVVTLPAEAAGALGPRVAHEAAALGLGERVELRPDPALPHGAARVAWDGGRLDYSFDQICQTILGALETAAGPATDQPEDRT
ncbi:FliH/SctL family protein [Limimaricola pyoseonensis]|uniref:Flagellar biosynthesis/type III secretory pathway protein FliH n=1 Tax=Limimaricola pyoseonensis TaxID=521013 RepID=A0A1G7KCB4_9RHOB|nr:FliH/SctL family protein [Limimaricola pyoseonensis]SDF34802.1 Flagellar biosynthesis/type III secretory pathway protein FliH [Limimaricola pyoseonensis]